MAGLIAEDPARQWEWHESYRDQFKNMYLIVCKDLMNPNDKTKNEAFSRLVQPVREWATSRRCQIEKLRLTNTHQ